ncbi:MAG: hypothetical protein HY957_03120 [Nitrospirae bacterium]|nr:hypothetical protein [Nitrospirota bacterium]
MTSGSIVDSFVNSFKSGDSTTAWKLLTGDFYNETLAKEEKTQRLNEFQKTWNDKYSDYMARFKHKVKLEKLSSQERL